MELYQYSKWESVESTRLLSKPEFIKFKHAGIYFLSQNGEINYVGQSNNNVLSRIWTHILESKKQFTHFCYLLCKPDESWIYESEFIMKLTPLYNTKIDGNDSVYRIGFLHGLPNVSGTINYCVIDEKLYLDFSKIIGIDNMPIKKSDIKKSPPNSNIGRTLRDYWSEPNRKIKQEITLCLHNDPEMLHEETRRMVYSINKQYNIAKSDFMDLVNEASNETKAYHEKEERKRISKTEAFNELFTNFINELPK